MNYPRLRPVSLLRAVLQVVISFAGFALLPALLGVVVPVLPSRTLQPYVVLTLLIPVTTYLLLSWASSAWAGALTRDSGLGTSRAG